MTTAVLISLFCIGLHAATWPGMILYRPAKSFFTLIIFLVCTLFRVKKQVARRVAVIVCKPLFGCAICMSSVYTTVAWLLQPSFYLVPMIVIVAGINTLILALIQTIYPENTITDENNSES